MNGAERLQQRVWEEYHNGRMSYEEAMRQLVEGGGVTMEGARSVLLSGVSPDRWRAASEASPAMKRFS